MRYDSIIKILLGSSCGRRSILRTVVTDSAIIQYFKAHTTDIPEGFDPLTKEQLSDKRTVSQDLSNLLSPWHLLVVILFLGAIIGLPFALRRMKFKVSTKHMVDGTYGFALGSQLLMALYLFRYNGDAMSAMWLFMSSTGTATGWVMTRIFHTQGPKSSDENKRNFSQLGKGDVKQLKWSDLIIGGDTLAELKRVVGLIENPDITAKLGIDPPKGILLYGPPGTGKTTIAKVLANEAQAAFFVITAGDINSMWFGQSEQRIKDLFQEARKHKPSIIFIDEIDSLMRRRGASGGTAGVSDTVANQVLQEIDGIRDSNNVFVVGATNAPDALDPALLRGGRLSTQIEIPLPGSAEREKLFQLYLTRTKLDTGVNIAGLAQKTEQYSGADIKDICEKAIVSVFERTKDPKRP